MHVNRVILVGDLTQDAVEAVRGVQIAVGTKTEVTLVYITDPAARALALALCKKGRLVEVFGRVTFADNVTYIDVDHQKGCSFRVLDYSIQPEEATGVPVQVRHAPGRVVESLEAGAVMLRTPPAPTQQPVTETPPAPAPTPTVHVAPTPTPQAPPTAPVAPATPIGVGRPGVRRPSPLAGLPQSQSDGSDQEPASSAPSQPAPTQTSASPAPSALARRPGPPPARPAMRPAATPQPTPPIGPDKFDDSIPF